MDNVKLNITYISLHKLAMRFCDFLLHLMTALCKNGWVTVYSTSPAKSINSAFYPLWNGKMSAGGVYGHR